MLDRGHDTRQPIASLVLLIAIALACGGRTIVPMSSVFDPESHAPGRAIVFGSVVFEVTDAAEPVEELPWLQRLGAWEDDLHEGFSHFSLSFEESPCREGVSSDCDRLIDIYVVQGIPNVVSPFVASLPPGVYRSDELNVEIGYHLWGALVEGLAFRAEADRATYVGRVVFQVPRVVEQHVPVRFELVNAEEHDRAALASHLSSVQLPFDKSMMGEASGTTTWTRTINTAPAPPPVTISPPIIVPGQPSGC